LAAALVWFVTRPAAAETRLEPVRPFNDPAITKDERSGQVPAPF